MKDTIQSQNFRDITLLSIRLILAAVFLYHGLPKAVDWALATQKFSDMGFMPALGPIIGILEVAGAVLLMVGVQNFKTNLTLAGIIFVAIVGVQIPGAFNASKLLPKGLERDLLMLGAHLMLLTFGPGKFSLGLSNSQARANKSVLKHS